MDETRFDELIKSFDRVASRRAALKAAGATGIAAALGALGPEARAKRKKKKPPRKCKGGAIACGSKCVNPNSDVRHCGGCGKACATGQTCADGDCVSPVTCHAACRADQTCPGENGYCPCSLHCGAGWCGDCCFDGACSGNANGNHCMPSPGKPGNHICGCRQPTDPNDTLVVRPCGPQNACSFCCSDAECVLREGPGRICPVGNSITGRNCCIAPGAPCGGNNQCCSGSCFDHGSGTTTCHCFPPNAFCDTATAGYCCSGVCESGRCTQ